VVAQEGHACADVAGGAKRVDSRPQHRLGEPNHGVGHHLHHPHATIAGGDHRPSALLAGPRLHQGSVHPGRGSLRLQQAVLAARLIRRPCGVVRLARSDPRALSGASRPTSPQPSETLRWMLSLVAMMILGRARPAVLYQTAPRAVTSTGQGRRMSQAASTAMPSVAHACSRPGGEATMMRTLAHLHVRRRYPRRLSAWGRKTGPCLVVLPTAPPRR